MCYLIIGNSSDEGLLSCTDTADESGEFRIIAIVNSGIRLTPEVNGQAIAIG